jgi:acid phosphatase (class A)
MSLISKVASIISTSSNIDDVVYLKDRIQYDDDLRTLDIDLKSIIPAPPKNSSSTTTRELVQTSKATLSRTNAEHDLVSIVDHEPLFLFYEFCKKKNIVFPTMKFFEAFNIIEQYSFALKYLYNRPRPEQLAPYHNLDINVIFTETHHTPSYPSGHTIYSELAAHIVSEEYPEYKKDFFTISNYCGLARILQGVHYASDNEASKIALSKLYPLLKELENEKSKRTITDSNA